MIVVFGSINVDLIIPVPRLPTAGETVLGGDYALLPGGKGANQALAARRAGAEVVMAGAVGADPFAGLALDLLRGDGVDTRLVRVVGGPTGCAAIMVSSEGENTIAVAPGANASARSDQVPDELLCAGTTLVAQMEVPPSETAMLIKRLRTRGGYSLLNLAPALPIDIALLGEIDLVVANEGEAAATGSDPAQLACRPRQGLVVTRGGGAGDSPRWSKNRGAGARDRAGRHHRRRRYLCWRSRSGARSGLTPGSCPVHRASAAAGLACLARGAQTAMPDGTAIAAAVSRLRL